MKPKRPAGWYSKAAKAERAATRAARRAELAMIAADALAERERKAARAELAKRDADRLGAKVERKARDSREARVEAERDYRRRARALRKELVDGRGDSSIGPNPHTRRQRRDSGLQAMIASRMLTPEMLTAAQEIERVFHAITAGLRVGAGSLEPRMGGERQPMAEKIAWAYAKRYTPWADELSARTKSGGRPALAVTIAVVIDDATLRQCDADYRLRKGTSAFLVCRSLLRYAEISGSVKVGATSDFDRQHRDQARASLAFAA